MSDAQSRQSGPANPANAHPTAMQAVVIIHGMGEQRPMDTIKSFVRAVWETDRDIMRAPPPEPAEVWSKPDQRTGSLELRRITTRESIASPPEFPGGVRTDFYELYWADLTAGTPWEEFTSWVCDLLFRRLDQVPENVRQAWALLWLGSAIVVVLGVAAIIPASAWTHLGAPGMANWQWAVAAIAVALTGLLHRVATKTFARVARYTRADPSNIAARQAVRERGLALFAALHRGHYKRIVVVSHSLGTILAHDLISYFWAQRETARKIQQGTPEFDALVELERAAKQVADDPSTQALARYYAAQRTLRLQLAARATAPTIDPADSDPRWLISDLVTLGSPLTHAAFLLARDEKDLCQRKNARELPTAPPFREFLDPSVRARAVATQQMPIASPPQDTRLFSYPVAGAANDWQLHHAAPFAVVRWTNIYDPAELVYRGDIIGGPLAPVFGPAIVDVDLKKLRGYQARSFTHTKYWELNGEMTHIVALRQAVNLLDQPAP